jgi:predicted transcriptional regulator
MATRTTAIQPGDLGFFSALVTGGSLSATARELGITTAAVSKRLSQMEARLGVSSGGGPRADIRRFCRLVAVENGRVCGVG